MTCEHPRDSISMLGKALWCGQCGSIQQTFLGKDQGWIPSHNDHAELLRWLSTQSWRVGIDNEPGKVTIHLSYFQYEGRDIFEAVRKAMAGKYSFPPNSQAET